MDRRDFLKKLGLSLTLASSLFSQQPLEPQPTQSKFQSASDLERRRMGGAADDDLRNSISLNNKSQTNKRNEVSIAELDIMPVFNLIYGFSERASYRASYTQNGDYLNPKITHIQTNKNYLISVSAIKDVSGGSLRTGTQEESYEFPIAVNLKTYDEGVDFTSPSSIIPKIDFKGFINKKPFSLECILKDRMPIESVGEYDGKPIKVTYQYDAGKSYSKSSTVKIGDQTFLIERSWSQKPDGNMYIDDIVVSRK